MNSSVDAPIVLWQEDGYKPDEFVLNATSQPNALVSSGGDLVLMPKGVILDRDKMPIGMAVAIPVSLPTEVTANRPSVKTE